MPGHSTVRWHGQPAGLWGCREAVCVDGVELVAEDWKDYAYVEGLVPKKATSSIDRFDATGTMKPFTFRVTLEPVAW
jgi:hypothetical protein